MLILICKLQALIAKRWHFEYNTPKKILAFRCSESSDFDEIEAPNAPRQLRIHRSRLTGKNLDGICVSLF